MLQIYALCCGYLEFDRQIFFPDQALGTRMTIPVASYLLLHPQGQVLFDTGVHCQAIRDPIRRLGERRATRFTVRSQVGDDVVSQLALIGMRPADITHVINSHFHFDHCGGNEFFPQATFLVQRREMARARGPDNPYDPQDFDHPLTYHLMATTTSLAMASWSSSRPTAIPPGISRCGCGTARRRRSCSRATPVIPRSIWTGTCCRKPSGMARRWRTR
jgi:Metallo-beta-lactamase superfamily